MAGADTCMTAVILGKFIKNHCPDAGLILCGSMSSDSETAQVGPQLAEDLDIPAIGYARRLELVDGGIRVERHVDDFLELMEMDLPGLVTIDHAGESDRYTPRFVALGGVEAAFNTGNIQVMNRRALGLDHAFNALKHSPTKIMDVYSPVTEKKSRVTLQILARATDLAKKTDAVVCAVVFGDRVDEYVAEYIAHGAQKVYVTYDPFLNTYNVESYAFLLSARVRRFQPETLLVGATRFGQEIAPRVAKQLNTGLTADCINLDIDDKGRLVQIAPSFGGNLIAKIITPNARPQMATIRPGTFQELPHDDDAKGEKIPIPLPDHMPGPRVRCLKSELHPVRARKIETADIVITGGRGMGSKGKFKKLFDLSARLNAEVGATRRVVYADWIASDALVGQAGKHIRPKLLFSFGVSGAIQHTAALADARFIVAVNKNPNATMMKLADVALVADANQACSCIIRALKQRIRD
jgi:electron transfer flavoprotein alpha subunit